MERKQLEGWAPTEVQRSYKTGPSGWSWSTWRRRAMWAGVVYLGLVALSGLVSAIVEVLS